LVPHFVVNRPGKTEIASGEMMTFKDAAEYPWKAESFAEFVKVRSGLLWMRSQGLMLWGLG